ncbi:hypothetical protein CC1G_08940 [Coprinopsis cinerea okayama7|uniref:Uncharacterized protein n=1 Tax=Coprinopsis cinerea (strain Okayama-7 / 130 / ATCC MYA-4618 / FGSC 9003) TaxID=240176 RepID=A8P4N3_COPC7|nr:hypothetical protein CC1G_08940 [Coprinopsis cinerea okayama7\|eukprot:XP_001838776.1 hypothetical protein CC1G_08940 [Coprinopsis cinerea okayama7\
MSITESSPLDPSSFIRWHLRMYSREAVSRTYAHNVGGLIRASTSKFLGRDFSNTFFYLAVDKAGKVVRHGPLPLNPASLKEVFGSPSDPALTLKLRLMWMRHNPDMESSDNGEAAAGVIKWLAEELGVSPLFFDSALFGVDPLPMGLVPQEDSEPSPLTNSINGVYSSGSPGEIATIWFAHRLDKTLSTYIVDNGSSRMMSQIVRPIITGAFQLPFLGIDSMILNDDHLYNVVFSRELDEAHSWARDLGGEGSFGVEQYNKLVDHYDKLHNIDLLFADMEVVVRMLKHIADSRVSLTLQNPERWSDPTSPVKWTRVPIETSLTITNLESQLSTRRSAVASNLRTLTGMMNTRIAMTSSQLAADTRKDSSSMTTIALMTMFFLPGAFVAAFFSIDLMGYDEDGNLYFSRHTWIFFVVTVLLTALVFGVWHYHHGGGWRPLRARVKKLAVRQGSPTRLSPIPEAMSVSSGVSPDPSRPHVADPEKGFVARKKKDHVAVDISGI